MSSFYCLVLTEKMPTFFVAYKEGYAYKKKLVGGTPLVAHCFLNIHSQLFTFFERLFHYALLS